MQLPVHHCPEPPRKQTQAQVVLTHAQVCLAVLQVVDVATRLINGTGLI